MGPCACGDRPAQQPANASGQEIDLKGLLCLFDAEGPSANAVKGSQRTRTHPLTTRTFAIIWGAKSLGDRAAAPRSGTARCSTRWA